MSKSKFDPQKPFDVAQDKHHRRSIRLPEYDYGQSGAYFVTIVAWHRECLFGEAVDGEMKLNKVGQIVQWEWQELPKRLSYMELGGYVVMPNHFHGILIFREHVGATRQGLTNAHVGNVAMPDVTTDGIEGSSLPHGPQPASVGAIMAQFKLRGHQKSMENSFLEGNSCMAAQLL